MLAGDPLCVLVPELVDMELEIVDPDLIAIQGGEGIKECKNADNRDSDKDNPCVGAERRHGNQIDEPEDTLERVTIFSRT